MSAGAIESVEPAYSYVLGGPNGRPYVLPDGWLSIDVTSTGTAFAILVQAESFEGARRVLERAQAFSRDGT